MVEADRERGRFAEAGDRDRVAAILRRAVAEFVVQEFVEGRADRVILVYNAFKSVMEQAITVDQLLPIDRTRVVDEDEEASEGTQSRSLAIFEPTPEEPLERLLPT